MAVFVVGPTTVGKSTFLKSGRAGALGIPKLKMVFGRQLHETDVSADSIIHYNLLNPAYEYRNDLTFANERWDYFAEPIFRKVMTSKLLEECIVLVAPVSELVERIITRRFDEDVSPNFEYETEFWVSAVQKFDLFRIYELLFRVLDQRQLPYRVLFSSGNEFLPSDRALVRANLEGRYVLPPKRVRCAEVATV